MFITYVWLLVTKSVLNSVLNYNQFKQLLTFCPYHSVRIPFCPCHFVRYQFVRSPVAQRSNLKRRRRFDPYRSGIQAFGICQVVAEYLIRQLHELRGHWMCSNDPSPESVDVKTIIRCVFASLHRQGHRHRHILSRFYSCTTTRPPSSPTPTVAPRCLPGLTFPDFDLAPKRNEKFGYCGLDLV